MPASAGRSLPDLEDWELIAIARRRDDKDAPSEGRGRAFWELFRRNLGYVRFVGQGVRAGDYDEDDFLQDVLLAAWDAFPNFQGGSKFSTWLTVIANRKRADVWRRRYTGKRGVAGQTISLSDWTESTTESAFAHILAPDRDFQQIEVRKLIDQLMGYLAPNQQMLVQKKHFDELTETEIAADMGIPVGTVRSGIGRAMQKLREVANAWPDKISGRSG